jgi:hypothetical protein
MGNKSNIFQELWHRLKMPWTISFSLYFIFVIIIFGGLGVILSFLYCTSNIKLSISSNLMTYSIALLVPACITILLRFFPKANNKVSLVILSVAVLVIEGFIIHWSYSGAIIASIISTILAWVFWIIANADEIYLNDQSYDYKIKEDIKEHAKNWN